ncbi:AMP-binding protein [Sphingomonas sp. YL-JM2C]
MTPDLDHISIPALQAWACASFADELAVRDPRAEGGRDLSYAELGEEIDRCAAAFVASGIQRGDRVALWAPNVWEWVVVSLAALKAGALLVPVNTRLKGEEAIFLLDFSGTSILFVSNRFLDSDYLGQIRRADPALYARLTIVDFDAPADAPESFLRFLARATPEGRDEADRRGAAITPDEVSLIMFTSGTTGRPKGAMVRGGAVVRMFSTFMRRIGVRRGDRFLNVNPYFHAFGFNGGILPCLMVGAVNIPMAVWNVDEALGMIEREKIAIFPGPPSMFQDILHHPRLGDYDLSSLRGSLTGASTIPPDLVPKMKTILGFERVVTGYGSTENSGATTMCLPDDPHERISSTCGAAMPGNELKIVDDAGNDLGREAQGELLVRGFGVMAGYYRDEKATREAIDADGWLHTGDVVHMDALGYIRITDRKKDMFIVGGFNVYPAEVELAIQEHPGVAQASVVGVPDARMGEIGAAFVVPAADAALSEQDIRDWCAQRLANYRRPRFVWLVPSLPRNASGKVLKGDLRAQAAEWLDAAPADQSPVAGAAGRKL